MPAVIEPPDDVSRRRVARRKFLKRATLAAGGGFLLAAYSGLIEPNEIDIKNLEIRIQRLPGTFDGFKIALLSDLHFGPYTGAREIGAAVNAVNALRPDMVALLGDFVSHPIIGSVKTASRKAEPCAQLLRTLRSRLGSFAILGNHDVSTEAEFVADALKSHGISLLRNESHAIEQDGARLWVIGADDALFTGLRVDTVVAQVPKQEAKILLVHEPDVANDATKLGIDVQFSGHSHGGQVRAPGIRPPYLPPMGSKYYDGYYRVGSMQLYTNRGLGTVGVPFRFFCPPEITLVTLRTS